MTRIVSDLPWDKSTLPLVLAESRAYVASVLPNEADVNSEMSIVQACIENFARDVLPTIAEGSVTYVMGDDPVEFIYDGLDVMALPEVVVDRGDHVEIYQFRSGKPDFYKKADHRLKAGGLTCWARVSLPEVHRPVRITEVYLRSRPAKAISLVLEDDAVRAFVEEARSVNARYRVSARVADFPATPSLGGCKFCSYREICPEYRNFAEPSYEASALNAALNALAEAKAAALTKAGGEVRRVFLSHVSEDKETLVRPFARALEAAGITCWIDEGELLWGDSLIDGLNKGLATSDYAVAFVTEEFIRRGWPSAELRTFLNGHVQGKKRVMPLFVAPRKSIVEEYPLLQDIVSKDWALGIPVLVKELERVLSAKR